MNVTVDELILLAGGAFLTIWGIGRINERRKLLKNGVKVEGIVFELDRSMDNKGSVMYYPIIRFVTLEKEWVTKRLEIGTRPSAYREGEKVKVIYDPEDIEHFILDNLSEKLIGLILVLVGILLVAGAFIYYIMHQL